MSDKPKLEKNRWGRSEHERDGNFTSTAHWSGLFDEGGPIDGATVDEETGLGWTDGGRTEAQELLDLGASVVNVFGVEDSESDLDSFADAWLRAHDQDPASNTDTRTTGAA